MEPTNQPFRKENDLPNLHDYYVPAVNLQGVYSIQKSTNRPVFGGFLSTKKIGHHGLPSVKCKWMLFLNVSTSQINLVEFFHIMLKSIKGDSF